VARIPTSEKLIIDFQDGQPVKAGRR